MAELIDPHHVRRDLRQLESAIRKGFVIADVIYERTASTLAQILAKGKDRDKIAAARVIVALAEFNEKLQPQPQHIKHHHTHDIGPVTEANIDQQRAARLARHGAIARHT